MKEDLSSLSDIERVQAYLMGTKNVDHETDIRALKG